MANKQINNTFSTIKIITIKHDKVLHETNVRMFIERCFAFGTLLNAHTLLKPKRHSLRCHGFVVHAYSTAHAHQCCRFQSYAKTVPSRMKLTKREPTFLGSTTTDHVITACDV